MAFWSKSKREDIENVKRAVSEQQPTKEIIEPPKIEATKLPKRPSFAPLFVKIERYQEVLNRIQNLKSTLAAVRDILGLMREIDKIKLEAETLLQRNIEEITKSIMELDREFVRPRGIDIKVGKEEFQAERVESYVSELQKELENLRSQLQTVG